MVLRFMRARSARYVFIPAEVGVSGRYVAEALVVTLVVVVLDEGLDLGLEVTAQEVVFQQDAVLQGLVPAFDLALGLRMIGRTAHMLHAAVMEPHCQITRDVARATIAEQSGLVQDMSLVSA